jgi:hypothetical protein
MHTMAEILATDAALGVGRVDGTRADSARLRTSTELKYLDMSLDGAPQARAALRCR